MRVEIKLTSDDVDRILKGYVGADRRLRPKDLSITWDDERRAIIVYEEEKTPREGDDDFDFTIEGGS